MISLRTIIIAIIITAFCVSGYAYTPVEQDTSSTEAATAGHIRMSTSMPMGDFDAQMTQMDEQTMAMQGMHDRMMAASTPEQRSALMAVHSKVMHDSMAVMQAVSNDMGVMHDSHGNATMADGMGVHRQMMEKRMLMMQSMMQMLMDRMPADPDNS